MDHEAIESLIPVYAAGAADPAERREIERHLPGCATCRALVAEYQELCDRLLYSVPLVAAPKSLHADLAERIAPAPRGKPEPAQTMRRSQRPSMGWRWPALVVTAAALILLVAGNLFWFGRFSRARQELNTQATVVAMLAEHPKELGLSPEPAVPTARGDFYYDPQGKTGVLRVAGLPPVPSDKAYQLWLIRNGQRDSGGLFRVDAGGAGMLIVAASRPLSQYSALGITLEPARGSPGPTTPRLLGGRF